MQENLIQDIDPLLSQLRLLVYTMYSSCYGAALENARKLLGFCKIASETVPNVAQDVDVV